MNCLLCENESPRFDFNCLGCRARFRIAMRYTQEPDVTYVHYNAEENVAEIREEASE